MSLRRPVLIAIAGLSALLGVSSAFGADTPPADSLFSRMVIVGASASAGFTTEGSSNAATSRDLALSSYFDVAVSVPHDPPKSFASALFFISPDEIASLQVDRVREAHPTLVVGLDFLFWFSYGETRRGEARADRLERGLKLAEKIKCPFVLGDIPDASGADPDMLPPYMIPTKLELAAANWRLREWAGGHSNVVVVNLADFMRHSQANEAITVRGRTVPAGKTFVLLQSDRLHPTATADAMLAVACLDALAAARPGFPQASVHWDPVEILQIHRSASDPAGNPTPAAASQAPSREP